MGIHFCHARFLMLAKQKGVSFRRTATIGRQTMWVEAARLRGLLSEFGFTPEPSVAAELDASCDNHLYAEPLLRLLGADEIVSIDASEYEGATVIHDMNTPISADLKSRFDVVIDGGTLEHVFNFPVAIRNCMEMTAVQGHFLATTPANNFSGHGFYQFSPELFYGVFSKANGFEVEQAKIAEDGGGGPWYSVPDPRQVRKRVEFVSSRPTHLMIQARKLEELTAWTLPQQSDYVAIWNGEPAPAQSEPTPIQRITARTVVRELVEALPGGKALVGSIRRRKAKRIFLEKIWHGPQGPFLEECEKL